MKLDIFKQAICERYNIPWTLLKDRIIFDKHVNKITGETKDIALYEFFNFGGNDNMLYLIDCEEFVKFSDSLEDKNGFIMQIKFMVEEFKLDEKNATNNGKDFYLRRLEYIDDNYKKQGYASDFMRMLTRFCENNNYANIAGEVSPLETESLEYLEKFYTKNGFKIAKDLNGKTILFKEIYSPEHTATDSEDLAF